MIIDPDALQEIRASWAGVSKLARHPTNYSIPNPMVTMVVPAGPPQLPNLPFFLAYSVLDSVLSELRDQGHFACKSWMLKQKMLASKTGLIWQDYDTVDAGRERRNELAHEAKFLSRDECRLYIDAVGHELAAWGIV
jgi:hypothetical protein